MTDTNEQVYFYSFKQNAYLLFDSSDPLPQDRADSSAALREDFHAIEDNVPKSFVKAFLDTEWDAPARSKLNTIVEENNVIVRIDPELTRQHIRDGAEEKLKEGKVVRKVRLVIDGRNNRHSRL